LDQKNSKRVPLEVPIRPKKGDPSKHQSHPCLFFVAEREGFEPSVELYTLHSLSRRVFLDEDVDTECVTLTSPSLIDRHISEGSGGFNSCHQPCLTGKLTWYFS